MMCYSFVGAVPLDLCVNHEYQISGQHVDPTGKEKTRMPSHSPPALPLLLEENLRTWRRKQENPGMSFRSALALTDEGTGFAAQMAEHVAPTASVWAGIHAPVAVLSKAVHQLWAAARIRDLVAGYRIPFSLFCCLHIESLKEHMEARNMAWPDEPFISFRLL